MLLDDHFLFADNAVYRQADFLAFLSPTITSVVSVRPTGVPAGIGAVSVEA